MCGIAGVIGPRPPPGERIEAALAALNNRGPDASGHCNRRIGHLNVCLIHTRLAIIDLDRRADQPFEEDGEDGLVLVYNGEIYNYVELKRELEDLGERFRTSSDTEVVLKAYLRWGEACLDRFEGMWALALLDPRAGKLLLSRDRFGEKPLYSWLVGDSLYFASEVKALAALSGAKPAVNRDQVLRYLVNGYKFLYKAPRTFFEEVREFPAASVAALEDASEPQPRRYWSLSHQPAPMTAEEALDGVRERMFEAVRLRLRADVPLAFCLSGGIDSCTLAAIAAKRFDKHIHCFSVIDKDHRYDERDNIRAMAGHLECEHFEVHTSREGFFDTMEDLIAYHDAPVATISYYVHSFLSEAINARGYKVAVSGTGADELFTGYYDHYSMWLAGMHRLGQSDPKIDLDGLLADWRGGYGAAVRNPLLQDPLVFVANPGQRGHFVLDRELFESFLCEPFHEDFSETEYAFELLRNRMLNELFNEVVPVILHEDDRNSMRYSVENRSPFLDRELAEFLFTVPSEHLIGDGFAKLLLRRMGAGLVPDQIRLDKRKRGFNASIESLVDRAGPATRERLLGDSPIFDLVRRESIAGFLDEEVSSNSFSKFLFSFISAKTFLEHHRDWTP